MTIPRHQTKRSLVLGSRLLTALAMTGACAAATVAGAPTVGAAIPPAPAAYAISTFAGSAVQAAPKAGPATASPLDLPSSVAVDTAGNVYIADTYNFDVEKVTPSGQLSVIAGTGSLGTPTPGPATSSALNYPEGLAVDSSGNLYIGDTANHVVEKVTPAGTLSIFAGTGTVGAPTAGPATSSQMNYPASLAIDASGNLFIADHGEERVMKVTPGGTLTVVAGSGAFGTPTAGTATDSPLGGPMGVAVDSLGNVYIADSISSEIAKVTPAGKLSVIAGNGSTGVPTTGPATSTSLDQPNGVAVDSAGNVYIADEGANQIEKVTSTGTLSVIAGTGTAGAPDPGLATAALLTYPSDVTFGPSGKILVTDAILNRIFALTPATVPGAPTAVTAVPYGTGAAVNFTAPSSTGGLALAGYSVTATDLTKSSRGGQQSVGWGPIYLFNLTAGDRYTFTVVASNVIGAGPASAPSSAMVPVTLPSPPTAVTATSGYNSVVVKWSPPSSNGFSPLTGYDIYEATSGPPSGGDGNRLLVGTVGATAQSYTVAGLTQGTSYSFTVQADTAVGSSDPSAQVSAFAVGSRLAGATTTLALGRSISSPNNHYLLILQADGNLVEYNNATGSPIFQTKTFAAKVGQANVGYALVLTVGGTLNLFTKAHKSTWSPTSSPATSFEVANDGTLKLLSSSGATVWKS